MSDDENDLSLFQEAAKGARPLKSAPRVQHVAPAPAPVPLAPRPEIVGPDIEEPKPEPPPLFPSLDNPDRDLPLSLDQQASDDSLFQIATQGVRPLENSGRIVHQARKPKPIPKQFLQDEMQALADSLSDHYIPAHELESGEELLYLRDGHAPDILRKLRRGHWVIQEQLDLHGLTADEARLTVVEFLAHCRKRGARCVRIIHGKGLGSRNREPVLKRKLQSWLMQRDEVIAYAQAREVDGGAGALVVLLKAS